MADFFKGLAGGFGTGLQFGQAMRERQERERLREAAGLTPQEMQQRQATPEEFTRAQAETRGLAAQDAEMFGLGPQEQAAYAPQMPVEGQRIGATQYGLGGQTFNRMPTQQEIQQARYGAMADVIAERDPARAMQMRQQLEDQAYQAKERPLRLQQLEGSIAGQSQQRELGELTIEEKRQLAQERTNIGIARSEIQKLKEKGPLTAAGIAAVTSRLNLDPTKFLQTEDVVNTLEIKDLKRNLSTAALKGEAGLNQFLADKFDPDKTDNIKPMITKAKDGSFVVSYGDRVLEEYGAHKNMMSLVGGVINIIDQNPFDTLKTLSTLETQAAQREESKAGTKLKTAQAGAVGLEKLSPLEKNIATLKRLNIPVTDAQIKTMALGAQKDPALEAELAAITKIAGSDTANPKVLEALPGQIQAALARSKAREVDADVISRLQKAQKDGNGQYALSELSKKPGMTAAQLQYVAAQAGIPYTAPAQPAQPAGGGLTTGAQPAPYVPPAGSPAAIAAANRAKGLETSAETQRIATAAQQRLVDQFASDARTLSPVELSRKYDAMRGQLPMATRAQLQQIERNIR